MRFVGACDLFYPDDHIRGLGDREGFAVLNLAPMVQRYADETRINLHGFANTNLALGIGTQTAIAWPAS